MIHLLWGLVNIGLYIFFIITCFRVLSLLNEKIGFFTSVIFGFGLFAFVCNANRDDDDNESPKSPDKTWKFAPDDSFKNNQKGSQIVLEKKLVVSYHLDINYAKDEQKKGAIPLRATSYDNGFVAGTQWKPSQIYVRLSDDSTRLEYEVFGHVKWQLLGLTFATQSKEYKGSIKVE